MHQFGLSDRRDVKRQEKKERRASGSPPPEEQVFFVRPRLPVMFNVDQAEEGIGIDPGLVVTP